jgi:hypothetical protein
MLASILATNTQTALSSFTLNTPTNSASTSSFAQQLAAALESYLGSSGTASNLQVNIQATGSQTSGNRQFLVTVTNPEATPVPSTTQPSTPQPVTPPSTAISPAVTAAAIPSTTPATPPATEEDAYWAMQPPAVQALRTIPDETERGVAAKQLADQGYTIDVPIMVWHWDPLITMTIRQNSGYTWVPSGDQAALQTCPNCDVPGLTHYDPNNPPPGSIMVSTAFAKGLESTAPWNMG